MRIVSLGGRRARAATRLLYGGAPEDVLARKAERAAAIIAWEPQVRSAYPWASWGDGREWLLVEGRDYDVAHRLWEAARRHARGRGLRPEFREEGRRVRLRLCAPEAPPIEAA